MVHLETIQTVIESMTLQVLEQRVERTRFTVTSVGIGSTLIPMGTDLDSTKIWYGDQIRSLNGTYIGNAIGFTTVVDNIVMDTAPLLLR